MVGVGDGAIIDHRHLVRFLPVEKSQLLLNRVGQTVAFCAAGVDVTACHLGANVIGQIVGVVERLLFNLVQNFLLLDGTRRGNHNRRGLGRGRGSDLQRCTGGADLPQRGNGQAAGAGALQVFHGLVVQPVGDLDASDKIGDLFIRVVLLNGGFDEGDQLRDGHLTLCKRQS